ncbi:DNRLRE domain-containing protein [Dactylosporangium sp. NPDC051541]|uniref:DNRLRE domain-containing protein n=1 Tax=Dactylosporangium sp. NPDC051541 TaxID=3363977 RepID=UPI00379101A0
MRWVRALAWLLPLVLTVTLIQALTARTAQAAPVKPLATCPDERADMVSASVTARLCHKKVGVSGARSETAQLWALPEGGYSSEVYAGPVRYRSGQVWKPVDLTLRAQPDGSVAPVGHPRGLKLAGKSDAGEHALASVDAGGDVLSMMWTGALPAPALNGDTATYPEVRPGVDLVLTATRTGFEQSFVAKDRAAAARVASVTLPLRGKGLKLVDDKGSLKIQNASGGTVGRVPTPTMWDAGGAATGKPVTMRPRADGTQLALDADQGWLNDPGRRFPVTIDPVVDIGPSGDTFVRSDDNTIDRSGSNELEFGKANGYVAQAFMQWPTGQFSGAYVRSSTLHLWNWYSASCSAAQWNVYTAAPYVNPITWANRPAMLTLEGTSAQTKGFSSGCDDGWITADVRSFVQRAADDRASVAYMGLRAGDETAANGFKQVRSLQAASAAQVPYITVDFDAAPQIADLTTAPATSGCVSGADRPWITSTTPKLTATVSDADSGATDVTFEWGYADGGPLIGTQTLTGVATSTVPGVTVPAGAFVNGGNYAWRVRATDGVHASGDSAWCEFTVDTVKPGVPLVSATVYPSIATDSSWGHGGYGQAGQFTFTPAPADTDVVAFTYQLDTDTAATTVTAGGPVTVPVTPSADGRRTLTVQAKDRAGQLSDAGNYAFNVGRAGLTLPEPGANVIKRTKLAVTGDSTYTRAAFQYRRGPGSTEYDIPLANLHKANGSAVTASPVRLSDLGGNAIWDAVDTLGTVGGVAQVRATLYPDATGQPGYATQWITVTVDPNGDGASGTDAGPGSVNLLTGDYSLAPTDVDVFGLKVTRTSNSRDPSGGWTPQGERLTGNQQQVTGNPVAATGKWHNVRLGDYTGDGAADLVEMDGGTLYGYESTGTGWAEKEQVGSGWTQAMWDNVRLGDYTGDGQADLVYMENGFLYGYVGNGAGWNQPVGTIGQGWTQAKWDNVKIGDYTGGGRADLVEMENGMLWGYVSNGSGWPTKVQVGSGWTQAMWTDVRLGDYTGDGRADLVHMTGGNLRGFVSTGSGWSSPNGWIGSGWTQAKWDNTIIGDYTGDGPADLVEMADSLLLGNISDGAGWPTEGVVGSEWTPLDEPRPFSSNTSRLTRVTDRGQGSSTDALQITPEGAGLGLTGNDTYAALGDDNGEAMRQNMRAGHRYRTTAWIYVPATTGLSPSSARGQRIVGLYKDTSGVYHEVASAKASWVDGWQELTVDMALPDNAVDASFRLYNGMPIGSGRPVYFDNVSLQELAAPFGPQWSGGVEGSLTGGEYRSLTFPSPDLAKVTTNSGDYLTFGRSTSGAYFPEPGAESLELVRISGDVFELRDIDGTVDRFTWNGGWYQVSDTRTADADSTIRYLYDNRDDHTRIFRVVTATEPGIGDCGADTPARGCQVLEYDYAHQTTATATAFGDYDSQVRAVKIWSWDPVAGVESAVEVARYAYDNQGRLREVWDARRSPVLKSTYEYDSAGHVTKAGVPGQQPWSFDFAAVTGDDNPGRLQKVRRAALVTGTKSQLDGETAISMGYRVPLTRSAGGPNDLNAAAIATWGQKDLPTDATAIDRDNGLVTVTYLNASGQTVNTATPGGHIDSQAYDQYGNVVWTLEATNRELALGLRPDATARATALNLPADPAQRAAQLATVSRYSADGLDLLDTTGPVAKLALEHPLTDPTGALPTLPPGTKVVGRAHTTFAYDEGRPDGDTYHLETTRRVGGAVAGYPDADVHVTRTGYAEVGGGVSGWVLGKATSTTTEAGTQYTAFDSAGRVTRAWGPGSDGTDARATVILAYTAGANDTDAACGNRPEWAGQTCLMRAAGAVTGHDPARATTTLPVKRVEAYSRYLQPSSLAETSAGKTRRTTAVFSTAGLLTGSTLTADDGSAPLAATTLDYDPATGLPWRTTAGTTVVTREYDQLGRLVKYTDADGGVTTREYDRYGRPTKISDNVGWTTYAYDGTAEPRGLLTSMTDSIAGTFTAKYAPGGQLTEVRYPGGITRTDTLDANADPIGRVYKRDSDGTVIYAETVTSNSAGQWVDQTYTGGSRTYGYDSAGRLTGVSQLTGTACAVRGYGYDAATNRTSRTAYAPGSGGCKAGNLEDTQTYTYDSADRVADAGYGFDAFGRITVLPTGLTGTYFTNDRVASQVLDTTRQTWTLDPGRRYRGYTVANLTGGGWANAASRLNHYGDDSDNPRWTVDDVEHILITRNVSGPDGNLIATTAAAGGVRLQLTNLHGDVAMTVDTALTSPEVYSYDEFGAPENAGSDRRYGWLGGKQRSGDALGDTILMGARLYSPGLGRFLSVDPVPGGSASAYDYCNGDAVNCTDTAGEAACRKRMMSRGSPFKVPLRTTWRLVMRCYISDTVVVAGISALGWAAGMYAGIVAGLLLTGAVGTPQGFVAAVALAAIAGFLWILHDVLDKKYDRCPGRGVWFDVTLKRRPWHNWQVYLSAVGCR